jgi:hypothetical protein
MQGDLGMKYLDDDDLDLLSPAILDSKTLSNMAATERSLPVITILKRTRNDLPFAQKKFLKKTKRGKVIKGAFLSVLNCWWDLTSFG